MSRWYKAAGTSLKQSSPGSLYIRFFELSRKEERWPESGWLILNSKCLRKGGFWDQIYWMCINSHSHMYLSLLGVSFMQIWYCKEMKFPELINVRNIRGEEEVSFLKEKLQSLTCLHFKLLATKQYAQEENCSSAAIKDREIGASRPCWTLEKPLQLYNNQKGILWFHPMQNNLFSSTEERIDQNRIRSFCSSAVLLSCKIPYCMAAAWQQPDVLGRLSWHDNLPRWEQYGSTVVL